jgi:hypothetical protein
MESMNPLLFKAHPLLRLSVELLTDPAAHGLGAYAKLISIYALVTVGWAGCLVGMAGRMAGLRLSWWRAYLLSAPALLYIPAMITVLDDVVKQEFRLADRVILLVTLAVLAQMLAAWFGLAVRYRSGEPLGLSQGLAIALALLLLAIPCCLLLLGLDSAFTIL